MSDVAVVPPDLIPAAVAWRQAQTQADQAAAALRGLRLDPWAAGSADVAAAWDYWVAQTSAALDQLGVARGRAATALLAAAQAYDDTDGGLAAAASSTGPR